MQNKMSQDGASEEEGMGDKKPDKETQLVMTEKQDLQNSNVNFSRVTVQESDSSKSLEDDGWDYWRYVEVFGAEFIGTGMLMCVGCMGTVDSLSAGGSISSLQAGLTFGMVVAVLIQIFGHISAAHFNPAVTVCFYMLGQVTTISQIVVYVAAEIAGATAGLTLLKVLTPGEITTCLCCTVPHSSLNEFQGLGVEFVITSFLIFLICALTDPRNQDRQDSAPIKFGLLIIAVSFAAGPYTGASMNPARSLAPAIVNNTWTGQWIYWISPLVAGIVVPVIYKILFCKNIKTR